MAVAHAWLRLDLRRPRRSLVVLAVLIAIAGATVMAALAGARRGCRTVADYTPIQYKSPTALLVTLLIVPLALVVANALAAWPGRRAAKLRIAHVLRTE
ncbi:MAG: hypothetical protein ABR571_10160 [Jatrophihabitans sp.]|uniref:hypothetical protein n=1 Tax=Jatrophihabitans sp. TaxID=1932789 RepID=UPI00390F9093